jgi:hypothetical protein
LVGSEEANVLRNEINTLIMYSEFLQKQQFGGRLHGAFSMCVSMSDKPFDAEACAIGGQASATNGLTDATNGLSDMTNV